MVGTEVTEDSDAIVALTTLERIAREYWEWFGDGAYAKRLKSLRQDTNEPIYGITILFDNDLFCDPHVTADTASALGERRFAIHDTDELVVTDDEKRIIGLNYQFGETVLCESSHLRVVFRSGFADSLCQTDSVFNVQREILILATDDEEASRVRFEPLIAQHSATIFVDVAGTNAPIAYAVIRKACEDTVLSPDHPVDSFGIEGIHAFQQKVRELLASGADGSSLNTANKGLKTLLSESQITQGFSALRKKSLRIVLQNIAASMGRAIGDSKYRIRAIKVLSNEDAQAIQSLTKGIKEAKKLSNSIGQAIQTLMLDDFKVALASSIVEKAPSTEDLIGKSIDATNARESLFTSAGNNLSTEDQRSYSDEALARYFKQPIDYRFRDQPTGSAMGILSTVAAQLNEGLVSMSIGDDKLARYVKYSIPESSLLKGGAKLLEDECESLKTKAYKEVSIKTVLSKIIDRMKSLPMQVATLVFILGLPIYFALTDGGWCSILGGWESFGCKTPDGDPLTRGDVTRFLQSMFLPLLGIVGYSVWRWWSLTEEQEQNKAARELITRRRATHRRLRSQTGKENAAAVKRFVKSDLVPAISARFAAPLENQLARVGRDQNELRAITRELDALRKRLKRWVDDIAKVDAKIGTAGKAE